MATVTMKHRKINSTNNYRLFGRNRDNRPLDIRKHKKLFESMRTYGYLACFPIVCHRNGDKNLIVKDGQHRLAFAETLGLPVYWVEASEDFDVAEINNTQKTWQLKDYAIKFAANGKRTYAILLEFSEYHNLPMGISIALLSGVTGCNARVLNWYHKGEFKVKDRGWADSVAMTYGPLVQLAPEIRNARLIMACMGACRVTKFDPDRLIRNAKRCREKLIPYSTADAYLDMLETIYNYGRKDLLGLKAEAKMAMRKRNFATKGKGKQKPEEKK